MPAQQEPICGTGGGSGNLEAVSIPGGNTAGVLTPITSGTVYLAGGDNITLSQNGQSITISGNAGGSGGIMLSLDGNTTGTLTLLSTGTVILAGGNNITLSQDGQSITISGANAGGAQTGISGIVASDATYTSGTVTFSGVGGGVTVNSNTGQRVDISVAAQSNQTVGLYASSNTYLTSSGTVDARSLTFRGDKSITVGISAGEVLFSVGAYLTTAMASNRGSDFVQATAAFNGTNASGTIASNAISVSVAAPVPIATAVNPVASANSTGTVTRYAPEDHRHAGIAAIGISTAGNSAGTSGSNVGTYWFQGGNSITLSQITSNNGSHTIIVSAGNYLTTAMASNRGSDFVQATAVFNGTNASGTIASGAISVSVAAPIPIATSVNPVASASSVGTVTRYAPEDHRHAGIGGAGISTSGNTAGTTGSQVGTYWFEGGNSITVSQITSNNGSHTLRISAGNYLTTAALSGDTTKYVQAWELTGNTAGTTSSLQGTKLYFDGGNSITVSGNSNTIRLSVGNYITTADLSQNSSKYVQNWKLTGNTAGTTSSAQGTDLWFSGGNSITVSGNSNTIVFSVGNYLTTAALSGDTTKYVQAWELTGNTAGTTSSLQGTKIYFEGGNAITVSGNSNTIKLSIATPVPIATAVKAVASAGSTGTITRYAPEDHQHAGVAAFAITNTGNTSGNTRSQVGTLYIAASGAITASQSTGAAGNDTIWLSVETASASPVNFSAGTTSNNLGSVVFSDSNNLGFGLNGSTITASAKLSFYATGNTTDNTTGSFSIQSVIFNAQNTGGCLTVGFSNGSVELSGASTVGTATTVKSVASANSVGTVTRWAAEDHAHAGVGGVGISTSGNTDGTTGSVLGTYWFQGGGDITLSQITSNNGSHTLIISANKYISMHEPIAYGAMNNTNSTTYGIGTLYLQPFTLQEAISFDRVAIIGSASLPATSIANTVTVSFGTSGQSLAFAATFNNRLTQQLNLFVFSQGSGGYSSDLATVSSTSATIVSFLSNTVSVQATGGANSISMSFSSSLSYVVSFPEVTSATSTSVAAGSTFTLWGMGYSSWTSSASNSTSSAGTSNATKTISNASTFPATTAWASNKLIELPFAASLSAGVYWLGMNWSTSSGTSVTTAQTSIAAGRSYTSSFSASNCMSSVQPISTVGMTTSLVNSLGKFGTGAIASMAPDFGQGTYSATYAATKTFMNNNAQANGEIALTDVASVVSYWRPWFQLASNRF